MDFHSSAEQRERAQRPRKPELYQARELQRVCMSAALTLKEDLDNETDKETRTRIGQALAQMVRAWDTARDGARIARGQPAPGSYRPSAEPKPKRRQVPYTPTDMPE
jgi:hypothetical protein